MSAVALALERLWQRPKEISSLLDFGTGKEMTSDSQTLASLNYACLSKAVVIKIFAVSSRPRKSFTTKSRITFSYAIFQAFTYEWSLPYAIIKEIRDRLNPLRREWKRIYV